MNCDVQIDFEQVPNVNFLQASALRKYIITGGPGFGITTVVNCLGELQYQTMREAARFIVEREMGRGDSDVLPWRNRDLFDIALRNQKIQDYQSVDSGQPCFFDRGLPDFVGWRQCLGRSLDLFVRAIEEHPYQQTVFMTQPWEEIYQRTESRPLTFAESSKIHLYLMAGYEKIGCRLVVLPKADPSTRAQFVLHTIGNNP
jgi:predicted ATPase